MREKLFVSWRDPEALKAALLRYRSIKPNAVLCTPCWEWTRTRKSEGYGVQHIDGKQYRIPRVSKIIFDDLDPKSDLCVLHKCDNPPCFNPDHLFLGTKADNGKDRAAKKRRGDPYLKLNVNLVVEAFRLLEGGTPATEVAASFKVAPVTIYRLKSGRSWKSMQHLNPFQSHL